jgi:hypothetical protein
MKITSFLKFALATAALLLSFATNLSAQILYSQLTSTNKYQLRQVNGEGSGDTAVGLPFANVTGPVWSRDSALFAVTASDPNRPNEHGMNVYAINPATGGIQQITNYQDTPVNPQTGTYSFHLPYYKAFSPDRGAMAVSRFFVTAGPNGTSQVTPVLEVFSTATPANPLIVHQHRGRANTHHGLEGVDWHPAANLLVTPLEASAPWLRDSRYSEAATALFRLDPVDGAVNKGLAQQITFPRADVAADFSFRWAEHDYLPRFSPNGVGVAYVRSIQGFSSGGVEPDIQSLRILNFNTGGDIEVARFSAGGYVTSLDWSPDGTALVFSIGPQENGSNGLQQSANLQAIEIYIINVDGTGFRRLRGAGAATPGWKPLTTGQPTPTPPPSTPRQLLNIATRMEVGADPNQLIGGFTISGSEPKKVILLATGPSLAAFGIQGLLANPVLELYQGNTLIASNDNWKIPAQTEIEATQLQPKHDLESALVQTLAPGAYTAVVRGSNGTGVGTVQVYDLAPTSQSKASNLSSRGFIQPGEDKVMIAGFIIGGNSGADSRMVVRALGPSLSAFGIAQVIPDPTLELKDANGSTLASNDDWQQTQAAEINARNLAPGDIHESALAISLPNGGYTAIVRGKGGATGVAVVDVYNVE